MRYHIRRKDKEITDKKQQSEVLNKTSYITLAMVDKGEPYLVSLSHMYDEEANCIYFHSASEGKKLDILHSNPHVWGQAVLDHGYHVGQCSHLYASVMFKGKVSFIEDTETKRRVFRDMILKLEPDPDSIMDRMLSSKGLPSTVMGKIDIEYMTGKKSAEVTL